MKKILHLITHAGGGHRTAADAIETAIKEIKGQEAYEHKIVDIWSLGSKNSQFVGNKSYDILVNNVPRVYEAMFWISNNAPAFKLIRSYTYNAIGKKMKQLIETEKPDAVVSVHPLSNYPLFRCLKEMGLLGKVKTANVILELITVHRAWIESKEFDLIFAPTREAEEMLLKFGHPREKVKFLGPLVRPRFLKDYGPKEEFRKSQDLAPDKFTIMIMGGAVGFGKIFEIAKELDAVNKDNIQLVILVSRNKDVIKALKEHPFKCKIKPYGFTPHVPQLMHASDMIITKAGSVTTSEALACGLPMIIDSYIPGQEAGNPPWIEKNKFGRFIRDPRKIAETVKEWIETGKTQEYRENIKTFFNPRSSFEIAEEIIRLVD